MTTQRMYDEKLHILGKMTSGVDLSDISGARALQKEAMRKLAQMRPSSTVHRDAVEEKTFEIEAPNGIRVPVRTYTPKAAEGLRPGLIHFHGGGFCLGDLDSDHDFCLDMASETLTVCVNVDYRLAPEHPFPAAFDDGYAVCRWVVSSAEALGIDAKRIAVSGTSAGGNLAAAAMALKDRDLGHGDVVFQMLFFPVLDDLCRTLSMREAVDTYIWNRQNSLDMWDHYLGKNRSEVSPYAAPARSENLSGLPPAYIVTAEHDPLRDEGLEYALRLMRSGVPVELHNYAGTFHVFDKFARVKVSQSARAERLMIFDKFMKNLSTNRH